MTNYQIYVIPTAWAEMQTLPGNMKQRVKRAIEDLTKQPRPTQSKQLEIAQSGAIVCRIRLDKWRIVYAIDENSKLIRLVAVRKRPPYDYEDLEELLEKLL